MFKNQTRDSKNFGSKFLDLGLRALVLVCGSETWDLGLRVTVYTYMYVCIYIHTRTHT